MWIDEDTEIKSIEKFGEIATKRGTEKTYLLQATLGVCHINNYHICKCNTVSRVIENNMPITDSVKKTFESIAALQHYQRPTLFTPCKAKKRDSDGKKQTAVRVHFFPQECVKGTFFGGVCFIIVYSQTIIQQREPSKKGPPLEICAKNGNTG